MSKRPSISNLFGKFKPSGPQDAPPAEESNVTDFDLYAALGLTRQANATDVKKAYREKALRWHPDKVGSSWEAQRRFTQISEAYRILVDEKRRQVYDQQCPAAGMGPPPVEEAWSPPPRTEQWSPYQQIHAPAYAPQQPQASWTSQPQRQAAPAPRQPETPWMPQQQPQCFQDASQAPASQPWQQEWWESQWQPEWADSQSWQPDWVDSQPEWEEPQRISSISSRRDENFNLAEINASTGDLRAIGAFFHAGRAWIPRNVCEVVVGRATNTSRQLRLAFAADYIADGSRGGTKSPPELDLRQPTGKDLLKKAVLVRIDKMSKSTVTASLTIQVNKTQVGSSGELKIRIRFGLDGDPADLQALKRRSRQTPVTSGSKSNVAPEIASSQDQSGECSLM